MQIMIIMWIICIIQIMQIIFSDYTDYTFDYTFFLDYKDNAIFLYHIISIIIQKSV